MTEFEAWLDQMAANPLPGGVAAAAIGAAMGAALVAKVVGIRESRQAPDAGGRRARQAVYDLAQLLRVELVQLAAADEAAYRRVRDTRQRPAGDEERRQARQRATDVPLSVAEACRPLLAALSGLAGAGSPAAAVDLEIGRRLLEAGVEAGMLAAGENLGAWSQDLDVAAYRRRLAALRGGK